MQTFEYGSQEKRRKWRDKSLANRQKGLLSSLKTRALVNVNSGAHLDALNEVEQVCELRRQQTEAVGLCKEAEKLGRCGN